MSRKNKRFVQQQQSNPVAPPTATLKDTFRARSIPLEADFGNIIDVADCGRRAVGLSPDFIPSDSTVTGLESDDNGQLHVVGNRDTGITVTTRGVGITHNPDKGIVVDSNGCLAVNPDSGKGIQMDVNGVAVRVNTQKGIMVDEDGVGLIDNVRTPPVGTVLMWPFSGTIPDGWWLCDGSSVNGAQYPLLAAAFGTSGNFTLPDFRNHYPRGFNSEPGENVAGNIAGRTGKPDGFNLTLSPAGEHSHTYLKMSRSVSQSSTNNRDFANPNLSEVDTAPAGAHSHSVSTDSTYGSTQTRPKSITMNFIISHD